MTPTPIRRPSRIRPVYRGHRGQRIRESRIRASDLPAIAEALGITVNDILAIARAA